MRRSNFIHEVLSFNDYMMTRDVIFRNINTGTVETCFDDSDVRGDKAFDLELGGIYDCKIMLFGDEVKEGTVLECGKRVCCKIVRRNVPVGIMNMVQVLVDGNVYYINQCRIENIMDKDAFWYNYTRKDLLQVNDVIKGCYLPKHRS